MESSQTLPTGDGSDDADLSSMSAAPPPPLDDAEESPPSSRTDDPTTPPSKLALFFGLTRRNLKRFRILLTDNVHCVTVKETLCKLFNLNRQLIPQCLEVMQYITILMSTP